MPLLTITNLTTGSIPFQDPTGLSALSLSVPGSGALTDQVVTLEQLAALEPLLKVEATAAKITWSVKDDPASQADSMPLNLRTGLVTPIVTAVGEDVIISKLTSPGAVSVTLPAAAAIGAEVIVVDGTVDAASNNITVTVAGSGSPTINGGASFVMNVSGMGARFIKTAATKWSGFAMGLTASAATGSAGGDLTGSYPNPTIGANKVLYSNLSATIHGAAQALSGAGAVDITHRTTKLTSTGAAQAITLADGALVGQRKTIIHAVDGGSMVLTPTHLAIGTTITFTAVRDSAELEWNGTAWDIVTLVGATTG